MIEKRPGMAQFRKTLTFFDLQNLYFVVFREVSSAVVGSRGRGLHQLVALSDPGKEDKAYFTTLLCSTNGLPHLSLCHQRAVHTRKKS